MEPILQVQNLTKIFPGRGKTEVAAVDHISFDLLPGETLGIVGESGSGKSTVARLLTRLIDASDGSIVLDSLDITHLKGRALKDTYRKIQMVFQNPVGSFDPRRTLGDGIGESLKNAGLSKAETKKQVAELLQMCGLTTDFADRYPHEVSGGECQRAAIARALAIHPQILICDEATSALDVTVQQQIMELLRTLRKEKGIACIFICHNLALVQSFCDRLVVMYDGKIVEEGTPDNVIFRPTSAYTKQLVDAIL
jgi:peptide/nickel transport system ATP-binding protein